ncbi:MAG: alanine:cation symporter family protein, partial [Selenomonadaceae bacterium]|nr:alanine:cation symporter family protein [Selenomonadaceae bacterium]
GGPGAIFWMWISAFFGMATIYGEATLAQTYKTTTDDGEARQIILYSGCAFSM